MQTEQGSNAYIILDTLSRNKRYIIYLGKNYFNGDKAVIKTLEPKCSAWDEQMEELYNEAETGQKLSHSCIIKHISSFEEDRKVYSVMECFESFSLESKLNEGPRAGRTFGLDGALMLINQMLKALEYANGLGIYHPCLNPSNILLTSENQLKIMGFGKSGLSWLRIDQQNPGIHPVLYLSPEQYRGEHVSSASNQYSFAVIAYQILTGFLPWNCNPKDNHLRQKELSFGKPVLDPEMLGSPIPRWLFGILNKCLMLEPSLRFSCIAELREAIRLEAVIPFQSVLTKPKPVAPSVIIQEPIPEETPIPEPELESPEPAPLPLEPEPIEEPAPEVTSSEPLPMPDLVEPEPLTDEIHPPLEAPPSEPAPVIPPPKPAPATTYKGNWSYNPPQQEPEEIQELSRNRKAFSVLIVISLLIVGYYILKYTVFKPKERFTVLEEAPLTEDQSSRLKANQALKMVSVPADTVSLGMLGEGGEADEYPQLRIYVPAFYISSTEVTQAEWNMVFAENPSRQKGDNLPVHNITFYEAVEWCNEKSLKDGFKPCYEYWNDDLICDFSADGYRLPTEAEWEYAARGGRGTETFLYSGSNNAQEVAWFDANSSGEVKTTGRKKPNSLRLYDMSGNIGEWIWNWYAPYSYNIQRPFEGAATGTDKVVRGGSWFEDENKVRITNRDFAKPFSSSPYIGFRVVRSLTTP